MASLAAIDPDLETLMQRFASKQVRASGTVGGNIANGSPIGDSMPALIALGATLRLQFDPAHLHVFDAASEDDHTAPVAVGGSSEAVDYPEDNSKS